MAENIDKLVKAWAKEHGAQEALARKDEYEHMREMRDLYEREKKLIEESHERELEEKQGEDSWLGRRGIGAKHWWKRTKTSASHWGQRTGKRIKRAPAAAGTGMRRAITGTPGLAAAIPGVGEAEIAEKGIKAIEKTKEEATKKAKKWGWRIFRIVLVLAIIGLVYMYFTGTTTGTLASAEAGTIVAPVTNAAQESGLVK